MALNTGCASTVTEARGSLSTGKKVTALVRTDAVRLYSKTSSPSKAGEMGDSRSCPRAFKRVSGMSSTSM